MRYLQALPYSLIIPLIIIFILLIILSGVEYAYLASNKLTIELKRNRGNNSGKLLGKFFDFPEKFWSGTVIGFYVLLVCFCFLFSKITGEMVSITKKDFMVSEFLDIHPYLRMALDFILASCILLFGIGVIAKRSFESYPEGKLNTWSAFVNMVSNITAPFAKIFIGISEFVLKYLFNVKINKKEAIFERVNTYQFFRQSIQGHVDMDESNKELFEKALQLTKVKIRKCMTPRNEVIAIEIHANIDELKNLYVSTKLSKIIVYEHDLDNILGYTHHIDLNRRPETVQEILHPIPTVPETMSAIDLIHQFTKERKSIAWVVDEFGGTAGFVTMEDVLEEVFGDINDEYDIEMFTEKRVSENEYIFSGRLEIDYLDAKYELDFPETDAETLSGFIIEGHESIPKMNDIIIIDNYEFEILLVTKTRIETTKMRVLH